MWKRFALLLLFFLIFHSISFAVPKIEVKEAWVSEAPPVSSLTAAYMVIENRGNEDDRLLKVVSRVSDYAEIHATLVNEKGVAKMKKIDAIDIPAGKVVEMKPGGYHIMLIGLKRPLKVGDKVELNLTFEKSGIIKVQAEAKSMTEMAGHIMMHNMNQ